MKMKKILATACASMVALGAFAGCGKDDSLQKIGVIQIVEHESLNTVRDSFKEKMKELGYEEGVNCTFDFKSANGETTTANQIVQTFKGDDVDAIVAIATPVALAAANVSEDIPVIFSAVSDPVSAKLVDSLENGSGNITGVSDAINASDILDFGLSLYPDVKKLGYIYNTGEDNSIAILQQVKAYAAEKNIELIEGGVTNSAEVQQVANSLVDKVDMMFTPTDNTIASAIATLTEATNNAKIPLLVGADSMVRGGGLATIGIDYNDVGIETAIMVDKILKGTEAKDIPVKVFNDELKLYINTKTAEILGVTIPDEVLNDANTIKIDE